MTTDRSTPSRRSLDDFVGGRDNNFNLIRFIAASAVLFSHSFALSSGDRRSEPLSQSLGITFGTIAVDVFFLTSGFLITASLLARRHVPSFAFARILRIYPALVTAVLLTVAAVGLGFTSLAPSEFFSNSQTWAYLARNATLVTGVAHTLPGALEHNPWPHAVNASLWTLPYELAMYTLLALVWLAIASLRASHERWFHLAVSAIALLTAIVFLGQFDVPAKNGIRLTAMFFVGACFYLFRRSIPVDKRLFAVLALAILASGFDRGAFQIVYPLALPYVVFCAAYLPGGVIRAYNRLGDYSYGVYVYAFPVQQLLAASIPGITPASMLGLSFVTTLALAVLSWHGVEKRALQWRRSGLQTGHGSAQPR